MAMVLRWLGLWNAALWWGGAVFFTLVVAPGVFSAGMKRMFSTPFSLGFVAQTLLERYFFFSCCCGFAALLVTVAEWGLVGRKVSARRWGLVAALLLGAVASELWLFPMMRNLHETKYFGRTPELRQRAARTFGAWHGVSQVANLATLAGLTIYLWQRAGGLAKEGQGGSPARVERGGS